MKVGFVLAVLTTAFLLAPAQAQEVLYAADGAGELSNSNLYTLNPATGAVTSTVGPIGFGVTGLAIDPMSGTLYGSTNSNELITINKTTGAGTLVGSLSAGGNSFRVPDITFTSDETLYGFLKDGSAGGLVTIDKTTGAMANVGGPSGVTNPRGNGLAASPAGVLFLSSEGDNGPLRTISRVDGSTAIVATMNGSGGAIAGMAFNAAGTLYGAETTDPSKLVTINMTTGAVTVLGPSVSGIDAIVFDGAPIGAAVPALSEWMLGVLAVVLGGIGFFMFRPK